MRRPRVRRWRIVTAIAVAAWALLARGGPTAPDAPPASCAELADVMFYWAQQDLSNIELWPPEDQVALFADEGAFKRWANLLYVQSISTRLGDRTCGAVALGAAWCDRIRDLAAGSTFGRSVRAHMIVAQCGAA